MTALLLVLLSAPAPIITIDDAPDHRYHRRMLRLLQRHRVKATWFVNGRFLRLKRNRRLLRSLSRAGHSIQNHTYSHAKPCSLTARQFRLELRRNEQVIRRVLGKAYRRMRRYRPPYGQRCHYRVARRLGYKVLLWDAADLQTTPRSMLRIVRRLQRRRPPRRAVLLFHRSHRHLAAVLRALHPIAPKPRSAPPRKRDR